jgi:hypothetical protein
VFCDGFLVSLLYRIVSIVLVSVASSSAARCGAKNETDTSQHDDDDDDDESAATATLDRPSTWTEKRDGIAYGKDRITPQ